MKEFVMNLGSIFGILSFVACLCLVWRVEELERILRNLREGEKLK
jgi:hypothetical protein